MTRTLYPPLIARYLQKEFLRVLAGALIGFVLIYLLADFFDRFDTMLRHDASLWAIVQAFGLKLPLVVTQVAPVAVLAATLFSLGVLARNREVVALRACGVSLWQILTPFLVIGALVSATSIAWNEVVVPAAAGRWHHVWNHDIKKKTVDSIFAGREVWYRGEVGFYNVERVRIRERTLLGVTIYQLNDGFTPDRIITARRARWGPEGWHLESAQTQTEGPDGIHVEPGVPAGFQLPETLDDFRVVDLEPEAFSFAMLREQIRRLRARGVDTTEGWVDLYLKLALPAGSIIMVLIGVPLATRGGQNRSLGAAAALALAIGFAYFVLLAFARALGQNGALPPMAAAWISNGLFTLVGIYLLLGSE